MVNDAQYTQTIYGYISYKSLMMDMLRLSDVDYDGTNDDLYLQEYIESKIPNTEIVCHYDERNDKFIIGYVLKGKYYNGRETLILNHGNIQKVQQEYENAQIELAELQKLFPTINFPTEFELINILRFC